MKKILFLIHNLGFGGAEKVLVNLANNMDKSKYDITVQTLFDVGTNKQFISDDVHYVGGWKHMFRGNVTLMKLFSPKILYKFLIKDDYDVVISFLEGPCARILSASKSKKVAWIHVEYKEESIVTEAFKNLDETIECYNSFDKVICVAETVKNSFLSFVNTNTPVQVLYNVNETKYIIEKGTESQTFINDDYDGFNLISVGRLSIGHKGFDRLINIHKKLNDKGIKNKLYIVGEGEDHTKLQNQIDELGLTNTCFLIGFDENPYKYVSKADLFICSSRKEGFSTAVTESLILGVPVVSTEVSGAKELLGNENEFGIVTENDEDSLYEGVYRMLTESGLINHYKLQSEVRGKEFSTEKTTLAVEQMIDNL